MRKHLFGLTLEELKSLSIELGLPAFTGRQLAGWLYKNEISSFERSFLAAFDLLNGFL